MNKKNRLKLNSKIFMNKINFDSKSDTKNNLNSNSNSNFNFKKSKSDKNNKKNQMIETE